MLSTSNTTCWLKTSATLCGTLIAAPVAGCLYGQAIRLTAVPFNGVGLPFPTRCTQPE
jgi:hypothetical protein